MSFILELGHGLGEFKNQKYSSSLGGLSADVSEEMADMSLREIAQRIAEQQGVKHGEVEIQSISLNIKRDLRSEDEP